MKTIQVKINRIFNLPVYCLVYFCLLGYSILVILNTRDFGFQGDDFWYISAPFFYGFRQAFIDYVLPYDRPLGMVYVFFLFRLFGFNRILYLILDFFVQATTSLFFGMALHRVFPRQGKLIYFSMLFSFFLLPSASSLYVMAMTTARLGCFLFWLSVLMFQWWAQKPSWRRLPVPVMLYVVSFMLYDSTSLLILTVPIFAYPVWYWLHNNPNAALGEMYMDLFTQLRLSISGKVNPFRQPEMIFIMKMGLGLSICVGLLWINLFVLFPFGVSRIPGAPLDFGLITDYVVVLLEYVATPLSYFSLDAWTWIINILLLSALSVILFRKLSSSQTYGNLFGQTSWRWYATVAGVAVSFAGIFPFIVSRYGAILGFITHGRIFFSAIYGFAILFSIIISIWKTPLFRRLFDIVGIVVIVASSAFLTDLRLDWRSAAETNCTLWSSLIEQVPAVKSDTVFLFIDLQSYYQNGKIVPIGNRAVVFAGVDALPLYIQMLYGDTSLSAYYLYSQKNMEPSILQSEGRTAVVTENGMTARGSLELPKDKIIILERQGDRLVLVDKLAASDGRAAIAWKDNVAELVSNRDRIENGNISAEYNDLIWGRICR